MEEGWDDASDAPGAGGGDGGGPRAGRGGARTSAAVIWSRPSSAMCVSPPPPTPSARLAPLPPNPRRGDQSTRSLLRRPARSPCPEGTAAPATIGPSSMVSSPSPRVVAAMATPAANLSTGPRTGAMGVRGT